MRQQSVDLAAIGAPPRPSDFDLHRDGRAVLTDPDRPELVRCALPAGPCERVAVSVAHLPAQEVLPLNAAKIFVDDEGGRYFISDNAGHRVVVTDFGGKLINATEPNILRHPNRLRIAAPGRLEVVDTDHRRIAAFEISSTGIGAFISGWSTRAPFLRPARWLPFDIEPLPGGGSAVLIGNPAGGMRDADLVLFDRGGVPLRRVDLGPDSDPFDVFVWRDLLWVADATRYRLDAVGFDGTGVQGLQDAAFLDELRAAREEPEAWRFYRASSQVGLVVIPLLGALLLSRIGGEAPPAPVSADPAIESVRWLQPRRQYVQRMGWLGAGSWVFLALFVTWIAIFLIRYQGAIFSWAGVRTAVPALAILLLISVTLFFAMRAVASRMPRIRLGTAANALHFVLPDPLWPRWHRGQVPWARTYFDGQRLLAGNHLVLLRAPLYGPVFDHAELQREVLPRIPPENVVSRARFTRLALPALKSQLIFIVLIALLAVVVHVLVRGRLL